MVKLDVDQLARDLHKIVKPMQDHFSYKPGAYYSHSLFFLSIAIHRVLPESTHKVIMLDADLKFMDDIANLYSRFHLFGKDSLIGIGHDLQPVYRHAFWKYRQEHPGDTCGGSGTQGLAWLQQWCPAAGPGQDETVGAVQFTHHCRERDSDDRGIPLQRTPG